MPSKESRRRKEKKCPSLIDKVALEAENRREILISREQGKGKSHPPQRKAAKRRKSPSPPPSSPPSPYGSGSTKSANRRRRHPTYECRLRIPSLIAVFECCLRMPSPRYCPRNREADAPSPAPTTACSLLRVDGCCPSCRASAVSSVMLLNSWGVKKINHIEVVILLRRVHLPSTIAAYSGLS